MFLDIFPKKGDIREIKLIGDLLDAFFCPEKQEIDIFYDALVNQVRGGMARYLFAYGGQGFGSDVYLFGVVRYGAGVGITRRYVVDKGMEWAFG